MNFIHQTAIIPFLICWPLFSQAERGGTGRTKTAQAQVSLESEIVGHWIPHEIRCQKNGEKLAYPYAEEFPDEVQDFYFEGGKLEFSMKSKQICSEMKAETKYSIKGGKVDFSFPGKMISLKCSEPVGAKEPDWNFEIQFRRAKNGEPEFYYSANDKRLKGKCAGQPIEVSLRRLPTT